MTMEDISKDRRTDAPALGRRLSYRISRLHARLNAQAARILQDKAGISLSQWRTLVMVDSFEEISASEIVKETKMDKGMISRAIKTLSELGYIRVDVSENDHRKHRIRLTKAGRECFDLAWPHMMERQQGIISQLSHV
ncbi:MAG: MarR family winged helix-turn-helix transcriptional regulator, partial [Pseudomonadota bacterium]